MQLYAKDSNQNLIAASHALKQLDYFCLECGEKVRVKGGFHRHPHFFHLKLPASICKLQAKGFDHLEVQNYLIGLLPKGEAFLEYPFAEVGRIADVVWLPQKIVFEVQCSPISSGEIEQRNRDYSSLGFQVVWILHDKQFNQDRVSQAELGLLSRPHFFTDINNQGHGIIYDQFAVIKDRKRVERLEKLRIDPSSPKECAADVPIIIKERMGQWPYYFAGDFINQAMVGTDYFDQAVKLHKKYYPTLKRKKLWILFKDGIWILIGRPYKLIFQLLLERSCR